MHAGANVDVGAARGSCSAGSGRWRSPRLGARTRELRLVRVCATLGHDVHVLGLVLDHAGAGRGSGNAHGRAAPGRRMVRLDTRTTFRAESPALTERPMMRTLLRASRVTAPPPDWEFNLEVDESTLSTASRALTVASRDMATLWHRLTAWFRRERAYEPPAGRLATDRLRRLPSGGTIERLPGDETELGAPGARVDDYR